MNTVVYIILTVLLLMAGILILMRQDSANKPPLVEPEPRGPASKEEGEDHFSALLNSITPIWYWRVNHEYMDFINATIKRMRFDELNATPGLFEAQRRCSDLNSAVYKYYENIKKRCLNGELVLLSDLICATVFMSSVWKRIRLWWRWFGRSSPVRRSIPPRFNKPLSLRISLLQTVNIPALY